MTTTIAPQCSDATIPPFVPHPWVRGGHLQTILGGYLPGGRLGDPFTAHLIDVDQGDRLCILDSTPAAWAPGDPGAILVHGLGGSASSPYVLRVAARLLRLGIRVVRMNLRGAGEGFGLARGTYHAGRTDDVRRVAEWLAAEAPGSPLAIVGFSLGANLALKLAAEAVDRPVEGFDSVLAANPPIDLAACSRHIQRPKNRIYDRNFVRQIRVAASRLHAFFPDLEPVDLTRVKTVLDFDELYTAPRHGFASAADYYAQSSSGPLIPRIQIPGLVIHAEDDPFIPPDPFRLVDFPPQLALELNSSGGHLGYFSRTRWGGNRRWLDARLAAWLASRWNRGPLPV
ncbi:alpha/beta fold hydrolase [Singulisphaera sp. Ch08]|uniref:Alpha/beta fold hydrolase n=1 Tax=Singulisphaera sp. Ch08 TaxID=3120278 RepID=A0AAU7CBB8_9BACT